MNPYCKFARFYILLVCILTAYINVQNVFQKKGIRSKLLTEEGNQIDTMFIDRRYNENFPNGNTLVSYFFSATQIYIKVV